MKRYLLAALVAACGGTEQAPIVELPVLTAAAAMPAATTDLGYVVQIDRLRTAVIGIEFTVDGEAHASVAPEGTVFHPGHSAGGEVTGELPGSFLLTWDGQPQPALGDGTLIAGDYQGANFTFRSAGAVDELTADDPLLGHSFHLTGSVTKDGITRPFDIVLDVEPATEVIGAVFRAAITEATISPLVIAFHPTDPDELDTPFDTIDFFTLPETAGVIEIRPGSTAHNIIRRTIATHDHYAITTN